MSVQADVTLPGLVEALDAEGITIWQRDGETFTPDDARAQAIIDAYDPLPHVRALKLADLAEYRWRREIEGVRVGGMLIETDREARGSLTSAVVLAQMAMMAGEPFRVAWKTAEGFRELDAATLIGAGHAAAAHVAGAFAREAELRAQIEAMHDWREVEAFDIAKAWGG
jgi:hypothetical protein